MRRFVTISTCVLAALALVLFGGMVTQARAVMLAPAADAFYQEGAEVNQQGPTNNVGMWGFPNEPNGTTYRFDMSAYSGQKAQGDGTFTIYLRPVSEGGPYVGGTSPVPDGVELQVVTMNPLDSGWVESESTWSNRASGTPWADGNAFAYSTGGSATTVATLTYDSATHGTGPLDFTIPQATLHQGIADGAINWLLRTDNWSTGPAYHGFRTVSKEHGTASLRPSLSFTPVPDPSAVILPATATAFYESGLQVNLGTGDYDNVGQWGTNEKDGTTYRFDMSAYSGPPPAGDGTFTFYLRPEDEGGGFASGTTPASDGVTIDLYTMNPLDSDWVENESTWSNRKSGTPWTDGDAFAYSGTLVGSLTYNSTIHGTTGPIGITVAKWAIDQGIAAGEINLIAKSNAWDGGYGNYQGFRIASNNHSDPSMRPTLLFTPVPEPSTLFLLASGLFGLLAYARRKRR